MSTISSAHGYSIKIRRSVFTGRNRQDGQGGYASVIDDVLSGNGLGSELGCPTRETLNRLGLEDVAADLAAQDLLPA